MSNGELYDADKIIDGMGNLTKHPVNQCVLVKKIETLDIFDIHEQVKKDLIDRIEKTGHCWIHQPAHEKWEEIK